MFRFGETPSQVIADFLGKAADFVAQLFFVDFADQRQVERFDQFLMDDGLEPLKLDLGRTDPRQGGVPSIWKFGDHRLIRHMQQGIIDGNSIRFLFRSTAAIGQGDGLGPGRRYPDFVAIAKGFGWSAGSVKKKGELTDALTEMIGHDGPYLLDVEVPYQEHVLPMIPSGMAVKDLIKH